MTTVGDFLVDFAVFCAFASFIGLGLMAWFGLCEFVRTKIIGAEKFDRFCCELLGEEYDPKATYEDDNEDNKE
jgi:hypothetical protein